MRTSNQFIACAIAIIIAPGCIGDGEPSDRTKAPTPIEQAPKVGLAAADATPVEEFIVGRWQIQMDYFFGEYEARSSTVLSPETRQTLSRGWSSVARFDVSSSAVTFYRPAGAESYSYAVADVEGDAIDLHLYHLHDEFQVSLKRRGSYITMGAGSCSFPQDNCEVFFYFSRLEQ